MPTSCLQATISPELSGMRLDKAAAICFSDYSRAKLQLWIKQHRLEHNGKIATMKTPVFEGDVLSLTLDNSATEHTAFPTPQDIPLSICYEDTALLVINKPAGLTVHPGAGCHDGTLVNALLYHEPLLASLPRAGLIHRLDKQTTGLLVVAKTLEAYEHLSQQLQAKTMRRSYEAIAFGRFPGCGVINAPMGRLSSDRKKMAVVFGGRTAVTHYHSIEVFQMATHLALDLETGRTHQIRVHLSYKKHPLIGDAAYGGNLRIFPKLSVELNNCLATFNRPALHAKRLAFTHPNTGEWCQFETPLPNDFNDLLCALKQYAAISSS